MAVTLLSISSCLFTLLFAALAANAESHTVQFDNKCGFGTPTLIQGANTLSTGQDYTSNGPLSSAIAYLQTGKCGFNGENCVLVEMTLGNPSCPGCGSSVDLSLIPPHAYDVETGFSFINGCDGSGATCDSPTCNTAFFQPNDNQVQVACQTDNVGLLITFCGSGNSAAPPASKSSTPAPAKTSKTVKAPAAPITTSDSIKSTPVPTPTGAHAADPQAPSSSVTSSTVDPSATPSVSPPKCRRKPNQRRAINDTGANESRELYDTWHRRHQARAARLSNRHH